MQAGSLLRALSAQAGWEPEFLAAEQRGSALELAKVALADYVLQFAVYDSELLYVYIDLQTLPADPEERFALLTRTAQVTAHLWQDHPFYPATDNGMLRLQLYLPAALDEEQAAEKLSVFLDDADYLAEQLHPEPAPSASAFLGGMW